MESMSFDELKLQGNESIKEKKYQDALDYYSAALKLRPNEHTVFSNRSLAYLRTGKLEDALSDTQKCVELSPKFARGYMRKAVVLNVLRRFEESREAAVTGYLLRGSNSICKECVSQWLIATRAIHDDFYKGGGLPTGTVILSAEYFITVFEILQSRSSSVAGMSPKQMEKCLGDVASQLKGVLAVFGHLEGECVQAWVKAMSKLSMDDPRTSVLPKGAVEESIHQSNRLAEWVNKEIDPILYPIVRPLLILAVMVVLSRTYVLNCSNMGHKNIQVLSEACLVLFEHSIFKAEEDYIGHHIGVIIGLLDSFVGRGTDLVPEDLKVMEHYCCEVERLLPTYEASRAWEKREVKDIAIRVVANVRSNLRSSYTGKFVHSESLAQESLMSGEVAKRDALSRPIEVSHYMEKLVKEVRAKSPASYFLRDAENLIHGSVGLMQLNQPQQALEAMALGEQVFFSVFALQAKTSLWALEEIPSMISTHRNDVLITAFTLRGLDPALLPGAIVRWKCLFSEFRAMLIHFGLKGHFAKTFMLIDSLHQSGSISHDSTPDALTSIMKEHQQAQKALGEKWGPALMAVLSQQSPDGIQRVLESNEAILDITVLATPPSEADKPGNAEVIGALVLILPQGKPIVEIVDFSGFISLSKEWPEKLNKAFTLLPSGSIVVHAEKQHEADLAGVKLRELLFPKAIEAVIDSGKVECLYLCLDLTLSNLPLDLLPWTDGKCLFEKCSISYLSCCREVLREWCIATLETKLGSAQESDRATKGEAEAIEDNKSQNRNPLTNSASSECLLFADPDYDLEVSPSGSWSSLMEVLESFGLSPQDELPKKVKRLPNSQLEAEDIKQILTVPGNGVLKPEVISGQHATLLRVIQAKSPLVLHLSTHGFSEPRGANRYGGNFWTDMTMGVALAGINTYRSGKARKISPAAGTGKLTAMAVCGMQLTRTRLVYLSTCVSSLGFTTVGESTGSLAQAFRAAGAESVVATLWPVLESAAHHFAVYFYKALTKPGTKPSQALVEARRRLRETAGFEHWFCWGPFVCIGYNLPLLVD